MGKQKSVATQFNGKFRFDTFNFYNSSRKYAAYNYNLIS